MSSHFVRFAALFACCATISFAQVTLSGASYTQDFNSIGSGLPTGWSVYTSATDTTLGTATTFTTTTTSWSSTTAGSDFRNIATFGSSNQSTDSDRAIGWRPLAASSGARTGAVMLSLANTTGFTNFSLSFDIFTANNVNETQTYSIEYRVGNSGAFTQLSTFTTPDSGSLSLNASTISVNSVSLSALSNQSQSVYFRIRGTATSGTSLDTIGIDNFVLSYSAIPEPSTCAAIFGGLALLGAAGWRRRSKRTTAPLAA